MDALQREDWPRLESLIASSSWEGSSPCTLWNEMLRHPDMPSRLRVDLASALLSRWPVPLDATSLLQLMGACLQCARFCGEIGDWQSARSWLGRQADLAEQTRREESLLLSPKQKMELSGLEQRARLLRLEMAPWTCAKESVDSMIEHLLGPAGAKNAASLECLEIAKRWRDEHATLALRLLLRQLATLRSDWWQLTVELAMRLDDRQAGRQLLGLINDQAPEEPCCQLCLWLGHPVQNLLPKWDAGKVVRAAAWLRTQFGDDAPAHQLLQAALTSRPWPPQDQQLLTMHTLLLIKKGEETDHSAEIEKIGQQAMCWDGAARRRFQAELVRFGNPAMLRLAWRLRGGGDSSAAADQELRRALLRAGLREEAQELSAELTGKEALIARLELVNQEEEHAELIEALKQEKTEPADWIAIEGSSRVTALKAGHEKHPQSGQIRDLLIYELSQQNQGKLENDLKLLLNLIPQSPARWVWRAAWNEGLRAAGGGHWAEAATLFGLASAKHQHGTDQEQQWTLIMAKKMELMAWLRIPNWEQAERVWKALDGDEQVKKNAQLKRDLEQARIKLDIGRGKLIGKRLNLVDWMEVAGWALSLPHSIEAETEAWLMRQLVGQAIDERCNLEQLAQLVRGLVAQAIEQDNRETVEAIVKMIRMSSKAWPVDELHWLVAACHNQAWRVERPEWAELAMDLASRMVEQYPGAMNLKEQVRSTLTQLYTR